MKKLLLITVALIVSFNAWSQTQLTFDSYASKSIYSFIRYINWPDNVANQDFKIAVIGDRLVYNALEKLMTGRSYGTHKYELVFFKKIEEYNGFHHLVFIDGFQQRKMDILLSTINKQNTLLITESPDATNEGSMINFTTVNGAIKFEVSPSNIEQKGLNVDSRLTAMAITR